MSWEKLLEFVQEFCFFSPETECVRLSEAISQVFQTPLGYSEPGGGDDGSLHRHSNIRQMFITGTLIKGQNFKT